ncbi:MAG: hypothetical protein ABI947_11575 [Chloroflexota bacterium]
MKLTHILAAALLVIVGMAAVVPQAQAAALVNTTPKTVVVTEAQINSSYRITNPIRRSVTNKHVTLGDGIVTISATITHRDGKTFDVVTVWKPSISAYGTLIFGFQSATVNGQPATATDKAALRFVHQYIVRDTIRDYIRSQVHGAFKYNAITVTPGQVSIDVNVYTR